MSGVRAARNGGGGGRETGFVFNRDRISMQDVKEALVLAGITLNAFEVI